MDLTIRFTLSDLNLMRDSLAVTSRQTHEIMNKTSRTGNKNGASIIDIHQNATNLMLVH